ncbi:conserved hypothetical protein [Burkholderia cenocepacia]|uniref:Rossmann-like and DUF2520 domain-containing protein n=1 Tax=Burkholderia cenocepacia TaxID=95486 RepID=UPI00192CADB7|nr:Rossmann-like and DUF2520 domain-containing protein [Burkholderia cenocepacia]CAD9223559.1 conserved hypothetical protein [Burkholderia cenocepacia]
MSRLTIVGAGRVGKTLGNLIVANRVVDVGQIYDRDIACARAAVAFVGAGRPVDDLDRVEPADIWLLSVPDTRLRDVADQLARRFEHDARSIVAHCSGALGSDVLAPLRAIGWAAASAHPVLSFADPGTAVFQFEGTPVGIEGDPDACRVWGETLAAIGARCFEILSEQKTLYHGAAVIASNFLPVLASLSSELWRSAGLPEALMQDMLRTLVRNATDNLLALGPRDALTGPAARGDTEVVHAHVRAIGAWDPAARDAYDALSILAARLAKNGKVRG